MADELEKALAEKERTEKELEQLILDITKEMFRLMGVPIYQVLPPETESKIKGGG